jgi:hypothetical protein
MRTSLFILVLGLALVAAACRPHVDVKTDLAVTDVTTGWFDAGIVRTQLGEENKIVPTIAFRLKNTTSDTTIETVMVGAVYHQANDMASEWSSKWVQGISSAGLKPGQSTPEIVLRADLGYTSLQPRAQMLQNKDFVEAVVTISLKYGADKYVKIGDYKIDRQLLTQ